jgi:hypothetical protein
MGWKIRTFKYGFIALILITLALGLVAQFVVVESHVASGDDGLAPQQSTTGPIPPPEVAPKNADGASGSATAEVTLAVPGYFWRHGCGPTAVGMVVGYYDY